MEKVGELVQYEEGQPDALASPSSSGPMSLDAVDMVQRS
jgi:hypothetical protein